MRQFADLAGISNPYLSQIERGLRAPSEQVLDAIAKTLKVSPVPQQLLTMMLGGGVYPVLEREGLIAPR